MLKALELIGFKSFADKTRLEFPPGVTVVVGPNGSGKSNIVDAIKWVLGEQSVKSLRGKEMADVIFNGSGARRVMNSAEVTLTFDNSRNLFPLDTPEVQITRRVYRSGEGEYLINRQPGRLRDIRDLLAGTGLGSQAYSVIEQGKVDGLLQSSPRDRRIIFEEAAGISRFKIRKLEAIRRLGRVDQNLLRLSDIVDEVDNRLRGVKMQAGKARRYKEHSERLQELRTQVGLVDWCRLTERLDTFEAELAEISEQRDDAAAEAEAIEARVIEVDTKFGDFNEAIRASEAKIAANRERVAAGESTIDHERSRSRDLQGEIERHRRQLAMMSVKAGDLQTQLKKTSEMVSMAEEQHSQVARQVVEGERDLTELIANLDHVRGEYEHRRVSHVAQMKQVAELGNDICAMESQVEAASDARQRMQRRMNSLDGQLGTLEAELKELRRQRDELSRRVETREEQLKLATARLKEVRDKFELERNELAELRQRFTVATERATLLEGLERRSEGLSAGVKEVMAEVRNGTAGPLSTVRGLVADLLQVSVEAAPLVEVALGELTQCVVIEQNAELLAFLQNESHRFSGRVGFVWLTDDRQTDLTPTDKIALEGRPGVLGRADRFVQTDDKYSTLAKRLLGRTWIVEKLKNALELAKTTDGQIRFVTLAGELLDADGTLTVGPSHAAAGLISRRSELRALKLQLGELERKVAEAEDSVDNLERQIGEHEKRVETIAGECRQVAAELGAHCHKITAAEERRVQLDQQRSTLQEELQATARQHEESDKSLAEARNDKKECEATLADMEVKLAGLRQQIERLESLQQSRNNETTDIKVKLAKSEERLRNLHSQMDQFEESKQERNRTLVESRDELDDCKRRANKSQWSILQTESEIAELYIKKELFAVETVKLIEQREELALERTIRTADAQKIRARIRKLEEKIHTKDLSAGEVRHERGALADRLRDDYGIELAELEHMPTEEEQHQREVVQGEIDDLRCKLNNLGNVNMEALAELEELGGRHSHLAEQYKDLRDAKDSLQQIIEKINTDSRRLFLETLETVRGHFQTLFRDLFGGGQADIILENEEDVLECGIEIVARPPGKEPRSISLLSGGEKTLTCVALLLAIFRSRPSPFCVLDEVDAALDEANIDRFTAVLKDFLAWTQFVIITHSKKTMTAANTIYGVTMQESGVSKQVSVRFEDVSEDGHIRKAA